LPPEFAAQKTVHSDPDNWTVNLQNWADRQLSLGNTGILNQATPIFEKTMIDIALKHTRGRKRDAANLLGWGRNTLTRKIRELNTKSKDTQAPATEHPK
ncbi:MAG: nitrogen regulation protein NR(I), partial [Porticoccaceae bacterium]|nr:nitrogen regulation protein NR(I) [Porticoccaceae bacterium]